MCVYSSNKNNGYILLKETERYFASKHMHIQPEETGMITTKHNKTIIIQALIPQNFDEESVFQQFQQRHTEQKKTFWKDVEYLKKRIERIVVELKFQT